MKNDKTVTGVEVLIFWIVTSIFSVNAQTLSDDNPNFSIAANGITCLCPAAINGETGTFNTGTTNEVTYTKRSRAQLDALIDADENDPQIALTCTSGITDMLGLFFNKKQFNQDISSWDVSNVTNMNSMFYIAESFNQPLNNWDVSNVTDTYQMFHRAQVFNQPLNDWDVAKVINMSRMFRSAFQFNQSINNWDVSSVTDMSEMFFFATDFNQPLNDWDVSKVTNMSATFLNTYSFNQPLHNWDVSMVTNMSFMFSGAILFNYPLKFWDVSSVTDMTGMFRQTSVFNQDISNWCVEQIATAPSDFTLSSSLQASFQPNWGASCFYVGDNGVTCFCPHAEYGDTGTLTIGGVTQTYTKRTRAQLDALIAASQNDPQITFTCTSGITDMSNLFLNKTLFNRDISSWDVSSVTNMSFMLTNTDFNGPLNDWDVSSVADMSSMFRSSNFNELLNDWDVSSVADMSSMFRSSNFNQPLNDWDVSNVTDMLFMFASSDFNQSLNDWDVSSVTFMSFMFTFTDFNQPINDWDVSSVTQMDFMFNFAAFFNQDISNWCVEQIPFEPGSFSTSSPLQANFKPLWGESCIDFTWTGVADNDWNNTSNWRPNAIPSSTDNIVVNTQNFQPVIDNATQAEIGNLIVLDENSLDVAGVLKANGLMRNNGQITFTSDDAKTGQIDAFTGSYTGIGRVQTERFIPAGDNNKRAFRFLSSSVNSTESIQANWQEGVNNTGTSFPTDNQNPNPGFGTHISGSLTGANGFDATGSGDASLFLYSSSSQSWVPIDNTDVNTLAAGTAYRLMVRGNRGIDLTSNESDPSNTKLRATGNLAFGEVDMSANLAQGADEFSFVGNPYQAVVDYGLVTKTNLRDYLYIWDASLTGSSGRGAYVVVEVSSNSIADAPAASSSSATQFIAPNQAFFVRNTGAGNPTLVFQEANKATVQDQVTVFSTSSTFYINSRLYKTEDLQNGQTETDALGLRFDDSFTTLADEEDAEKLGNPDENYAIINNGLRVIDKQNLPTQGHEIDLFVNNYTTTEYSLTFELGNQPEGINVSLNDEFLGTTTSISQQGNNVYAFSVDASVPASTAFNRFSLVFDNATLGVEENSFGADFSLYPNPTRNGQFSIKTQGLIGEDVNIKIHNILGQQVFHQKLKVGSNGDVNVEASGLLSSGVYVVELLESEKSFTAKLIVK